MKTLGKVTFGVFFLAVQVLAAQGVPTQVAAQDQAFAAEKIEIRKVIDQFFKGLHEGDSTLIKQTLAVEHLKIQTTGSNRSGDAVLITQDTGDFLKSIASKKATDVLEEKLLSYTYHIDGAMASVWTPYEFYYNNAFSHCGVNSFHLFNNGEGWKIIYLIDTRRRNNCKE